MKKKIALQKAVFFYLYIKLVNSILEKHHSIQTPIILCGLGGSGTRVVTKIMQSLGYQMGTTLNNSLDNLLFERLFKNPTWFQEAKKENITTQLKIFLKLSFNVELTSSENNQLQNYLNNYPSFINYEVDFTNDLKQYDITNDFKWGWKAPNAQIYVDYFPQLFKSPKLILIIRNGLEMAFSKNMQQLKNWGKFSGIEIDESKIQVNQLEYWIKRNKEIISKSNLYNDGLNFHVCNYNNLIESPSSEISKLLNFLDHSIDQKAFDQILSIPKIPESINRHISKDLSNFSDQHFEEVKKLGFNI